MTTPLRLYSTVIWLGFISHAFCQMRLDPVVIRAQIPKASLHGKSLYTRKDFDITQQTQLTQTLQSAPGVTVSQSGGAGHRTALFIRGLESRHALIMQDGYRLDSPATPDGSIDLAPIGLDGLAQVKLISGPLSALYGSDALAGVVTLKTQRGKGNPSASVRAKGGSYHTHREEIYLQGTQAPLSFAVTGSHHNTKGSIITPLRYRSLIPGPRHDPYQANTLNGRFDLDMSSKTNITFYARHHDNRLGYRSFRQLTDPDFLAPYQTTYRQEAQRLVVTHRPQETLKTIIGMDYVSTQSADRNHLNSQLSQSKGQRSHLDATVHWRPQEAYRLYLRGDLTHQKLDSSYGPDYHRAQDVQGGLALGHRLKVTKSLSLDALIRLDRIQPNTPITYRFGGRYRIENTLIKANFGTAFKAPTLYQRFANTPRFKANPNLKPEKALGGDIGIFQRWHTTTMGVTYFWNQVNDLIKPNTVWTSLINGGRGTTSGIETSLKHQLWQNLSWKTAYTYTQTKDHQTRLEFLRRPQHKLSTALAYDRNPWQAYISLSAYGKRWDSDPLTFQRIQRRGYFWMDATLTHHLNSHIVFFAKADNLLNANIEDPAGYQRPGLAIYMGIKVKS